jgi:hypothetical protein
MRRQTLKEIKVDSAKTLLTIGAVFLACGLVFLVVGLSTHLLTFSAMAPAFIALGVVFFAVSRTRAKRNANSADR